MPRPSLNPDRASQGTGGKIEQGIFEVTGAKYQNIKSDFKANQPHLVLDCAVLDKDGDRVKGADAVEVIFGFGGKAIEAFHPGTGSGPDDADPKDEGDGVDAEGNTIYCAGDQQFNKSCAAIVFAESLVKQGFPKDILDQTYAPNFAGLKFALNTFDSKTVNEKFGTRLNTKPFKDNDGNERAVTYKVCEKWLNPNYLADAKNGGSTKKGAAAKTEAPAADKSSHTSKSDEELAQECLEAVAVARSGEKGTVKTAAQLVGLITNHYTAKAKMPADRLKAVQAFVKADDYAWAKEAVAMLGGEWGDEPKVVVFP